MCATLGACTVYNGVLDDIAGSVPDAAGFGDDAGVQADGNSPAGDAQGDRTQSGADGRAESAASTCGNGTVEPPEQCDLGAQNGSGGSCDSDCNFTCVAGDAVLGDAKCDDHTVCNGLEICGVSHKCLPANPAANGTPCGSDMSCQSGACRVRSTQCGDGKLQDNEECDEGPANGSAGSSCTADCLYVCVSSDPARNCSPADPCQGQGHCIDETHTCVAGTPLADDTPCGDGTRCEMGVCSNKWCTVACAATEACATTISCDPTSHACTMPTPLADGQDCGGGDYCESGSCIAPNCGDGIVEPGEDCDFGSANGPGSGCETTCHFSCMKSPQDSCQKSDLCAGTSSCNTVVVGGKTGQACSAATQAAKCTACTNGFCGSTGACFASTCGDGCVDAAAGEQCDHGAGNGAGTGCESNCKWSCSTASDCAGQAPTCEKWGCTADHVCAAVADTSKNGTTCGPSLVCNGGGCGNSCGNGTVDAGEDCDLGAGNGAGTGCESNCKFSCHKAPDDCASGNQCAGTNTCTSVTVGGKGAQKCVQATPPPDGTACGSGSICLGQVCRTSSCGDGFADTGAGEQCDFGGGNGAGTGCETNCHFSCQHTPQDTCLDTNACNGTESCVATTVSGHAGQKCSPGANSAKCATCASGYCNGQGTCSGSTCGDGCVDASKGEQCEPPGTSTCDIFCHVITACDMNGTWAAYTALTVSWAGNAYLAAGTGTIGQWSKSTTTALGTVSNNVLLPCGLSVPDFSVTYPTTPTATTETYGTTYPNTLFDHAPPYLPTVTVTGTLANVQPGAQFTTPGFATLLGLTMTNPATDPWPATYQGVNEIDQDQDMKPGVTSPMKSGGPYVAFGG